MKTKKSCAEAVNEAFKRRIETIQHLLNAYNGEMTDDHYDSDRNLISYGLCFDYVEPDTFENQPDGYYRWQISWGGPSEEFRFFEDETGLIIAFWYMDWFDGANVVLYGNDHNVLSDIYQIFKS